jgi:hypothetical protein
MSAYGSVSPPGYQEGAVRSNPPIGPKKRGACMARPRVALPADAEAQIVEQALVKVDPGLLGAQVELGVRVDCPRSP